MQKWLKLKQVEKQRRPYRVKGRQGGIPVCLSMPPTHRLEVSLVPELCIQLLVVGSGQQRAVPSLPCDLGAQDKTGPGWTGCLGVRYVAEAQSLLIPSVGVRH